MYKTCNLRNLWIMMVCAGPQPSWHIIIVLLGDIINKAFLFAQGHDLETGAFFFVLQRWVHVWPHSQLRCIPVFVSLLNSVDRTARLWLLLLCNPSAFLVLARYPQRLQGMESPLMWNDSMWPMMWDMLPSFPHTLQIDKLLTQSMINYQWYINETWHPFNPPCIPWPFQVFFHKHKDQCWTSSWISPCI